jgi:hypothetical protein
MVGKERVVLTNDEQCELISITANCGLHPLIHTLLKFNLAQVTSFFQRDERKMPPLTSDGLWGLREVGQD